MIKFHFAKCKLTIYKEWNVTRCLNSLFIKNGYKQNCFQGILKITYQQNSHLLRNFVDFVDIIVPKEGKKTISDAGNIKLIVSHGPKKPKLEQVTLQQWVVSNTRIFYNSLARHKLQLYNKIQHYLAYTIKIMELANRFQWVSDEFHLLQTTYLWSFDSNHLHTVLFMLAITAQLGARPVAKFFSTVPRFRSKQGPKSYDYPFQIPPFTKHCG